MRRFGMGAGSVAADAVAGAIKATEEITGETTAFVRDAVVGVMEGTGQVAKVGRPVVKDVVASAIRSSIEVGGNVPDAAQSAVEGAIVGAASLGVDSESAGAQASSGVVKAVTDLGGEFDAVVAPAIHGVVIGVVSTQGDLFEAVRDTSKSLLKSGARMGQDVPGIARLIVDEAILASEMQHVNSTDAMMGAAQGCVEAAHDIDIALGEDVRMMVVAVVDAPVNDLTPSIRNSITEALGELSEDLSQRPQAWRGKALWQSVKRLVAINGLDAGAALAYYLLLALFPLVALIILGFSSFVDPETIRNTVVEAAKYYFPGSQEFLAEAFDRILQQRLWVGLIALGGMLLGVHGMFMAANRGVNLVFGQSPKRILGATTVTVSVAFMVMMLFLVSVGLTGVFQVVRSLTEQIPGLGAPLSRLLITATQIISVLTPFLFAGLVFVVVYKYLPNQTITWGDATFGGLVTVIIFEIAKYLFLLFGNLATQRSLLYGSLSSVILLLIWSHAAGMIFLYGAALTKHSADLRPHSRATLRQEDADIEPQLQTETQSQRETNIALGRDTRAYRWRDPARRAGGRFRA